jgi:hypothetical protein
MLVKDIPVIGQALKKAYIKQLQKQPDQPLSDSEYAEKMQLLFGNELKQCSKCQIWKPFREFSRKKEKNVLFNFTNVCNSCVSDEKIVEEFKKKPIVPNTSEEIKKEGKDMEVKIKEINNGNLVVEDSSLDVAFKQHQLMQEYRAGKISGAKLYTETTKYCKHCDTWKPLGDFHKNPKNCSGRADSCAKCFNSKYSKSTPALQKEETKPVTMKPPVVTIKPEVLEKTKQRYLLEQFEKKEIGITYMFTETSKYCAKCETWKPLEAFWRDNKAPSGRYLSCKKCARPSKEEVPVEQKPKIDNPRANVKPIVKNVMVSEKNMGFDVTFVVGISKIIPGAADIVVTAFVPENYFEKGENRAPTPKVISEAIAVPRRIQLSDYLL